MSSSGTQTGQAVWFEEARRAAVRLEPVAAPGKDQVTVRGKVSLISQGTEMRVYRGEISADTDLGLETCAGTFAFPVKYAYQIVGEVVEAGRDVPLAPGDLVFAHHPHQSLFTMRYDPDHIFKLPAGVEPDKAVFANLADVAYNAMLDVPVRIGDDVLVFGYGVVGVFAAHFARKTAGHLIVVDPLPERRDRALKYGADFAVDPKEAAKVVQDVTDGRGVDIAIENSGAPAALQQAIELTGQEGTIVVISYFGTRAVPLMLAPEFHFRRQRIISSQVSSLGSGLQPRWTPVRRMQNVRALLPGTPVAEMITHRFPIADAAEAYRFVDTRAGESLGVVIDYP